MIPLPFKTLAEAIKEAKRQERATRSSRWVVFVCDYPHDGYEVTERMPLLGEWYDSDGIRHG